jgi:hypothetical protein
MTKEMEVPAPVPSEGSKEELFRWLGRRDAFSLIAGRCTAADAECIKRIHDNKLYLEHAKDWEEFCHKFLHMSKSNANRLLRLLDELGSAYFYISQVTRIAVKEYRACIAPAVTERGLECDGETIDLTPENSAKIAAAVETLRAKAAASGVPAEPAAAQRMNDRIAAHVERVRGELRQLRDLRHRHGKPDSRLTLAVDELAREVGRLLADVR